jgi:hypothetical protein
MQSYFLPIIYLYEIALEPMPHLSSTYKHIRDMSFDFREVQVRKETVTII